MSNSCFSCQNAMWKAAKEQYASRASYGKSNALRPLIMVDFPTPRKAVAKTFWSCLRTYREQSERLPDPRKRHFEQEITDDIMVMKSADMKFFSCETKTWNGRPIEWNKNKPSLVRIESYNSHEFIYTSVNLLGRCDRKSLYSKIITQICQWYVRNHRKYFFLILPR